jgi:two-component system, NarL family, response regulator NreC
MTAQGVTDIVLADDHAVVRKGLHMVLDSEPGLRVVAEAGDVSEALACVRQHQPKVLVLDLHMGGVSSLHAVPELISSAPGMRVVVLTMQNDPAFVREALRAGASGYVVKEAADTELVEAVRIAVRGGTWVSPQLGASLIEPAGSAEPLSPRETEVLRLIGLGYTNKEIAGQLFLSVRTVESHRGRIQTKLGLSSRHALVQYALDHGLVGERAPGAA